jgi:hypothetical protein
MLSYQMIGLDLNKHELKPQDQLTTHMNTKNALGSYRLEPIRGSVVLCLLDADVGVDLRCSFYPWCLARVEMSAGKVAGS